MRVEPRATWLDKLLEFLSPELRKHNKRMASKSPAVIHRFQRMSHFIRRKNEAARAAAMNSQIAYWRELERERAARTIYVRDETPTEHLFQDWGGLL